MKNNLLSLFIGAMGTMGLAQPSTADSIFDKDHTIDYLVVYDNSKKPNVEQAGGEEAFAEEIVRSINLVLKNSNLPYQFRVAGTYHMDTAVPSVENGLNIVANDEGVMKKRRDCKADLVVLISEPFGDPNSGLANHGAKHPDAYCSVLASMAVNSYTAAHESGHVLGCYHSRSEWDHSPSNHPWAAAYIAPEGYKTVMNTLAPGELVPIYSGPESVWKGVVMGDDTHDNVRMLRMTLPKAVHFGDYLELHRFFVSEEKIVMDNKEQQYDLTVHSNSFFWVKSSTSWIKQISPTWGNVEQLVSFTVEANHTGKARKGTITIEGDAPDVPTTVEVYQSATDEITGIGTITTEENIKHNDVLFDLSGKKVEKMQKGKVYILNGQRFLKK